MPTEAELFSVPELVDMASMMLNMILELYGKALHGLSRLITAYQDPGDMLLIVTPLL